ncbi:MAG: class I SAM-dependent methyltransferase [Candidatus Nomurabacteria bacterium]|nr:class I SAM-dependent methyltransferase [Candidatus Nomurabacteria bacterium]
MKLGESFIKELENIEVIIDPDHKQPLNLREYLNSENTFGKYLEYEYDEYFSHSKFKDFQNVVDNTILSDNIKPELKGDILELGAGSCKFSAELSKIQDVKSITAVEFSKAMLTKVAPRVVLHLGGDISKIRFVVTDMHKSSTFSDKKYDVILFHSALHHVFLPLYQVNFWRDMLKEYGKIICISEPAVSNFCLPTKKNKKWIRHQMHHQSRGNNENFYRAGFYKSIFTEFNDDFEFQYHTIPLTMSVSNSRLKVFIKKIFNKLKVYRWIGKLQRIAWFQPLSLNFIARKK